MNRQTVLIAVLVVALVAVIYYVFLLKPKMDEVSEVEDQIANVQQEQATLRSRIATLEDIRERAPQIEASLAGAEAVLPEEPNLPAALRQLQLAADESGARLVSVAPSRPQLDEEVNVGVVDLIVQVDGGYYQLVDFFRRVEDPSISPRAIIWDGVNVVVLEYPTLSATATGRMFVVAPPTPAAGGAAADQSQQPGVVEEGQDELEGELDQQVEDAA